MLTSNNTVSQEETEEAKLIGIAILRIVHDLASTIDGTRRYAKLLTNAIPETSTLKTYSESIQSSIDRVSSIHTAMLDIAKREFPELPKSQKSPSIQ